MCEHDFLIARIGTQIRKKCKKCGYIEFEEQEEKKKTIVDKILRR